MKKSFSFIFGIVLVLLSAGFYLYADLDREDPAEKGQYVKEEEPEAIVLAEAINSETSEEINPNIEDLSQEETSSALVETENDQDLTKEIPLPTEEGDEVNKKVDETHQLDENINLTTTYNNYWLMFGALFVSLLMVLLLFTTMLLFREVRWRKRYSKNESLVFPDAHLDVLENLQKGFIELGNAMVEFGKSSNDLQVRNETLSRQTIESISTFSNLIDQQKIEIERLKEGYDFSIKKHSIKALIELKVLIINFYEQELSSETKDKLDKISNYINLDLEELGVEELYFIKGLSVREISSDEFEIGEIDSTSDEALNETVIETINSGYVHVHPNGKNVIKKAKLRIYKKEV